MDALNMLRGMTGNISLSRTQAALGFLVSSCVVAWQAYQGTLSEVVFGLYFGFCTAGYLGPKSCPEIKISRSSKSTPA
ncbi:Uncharacterised protein [Leclercia adecarboxylata]|uniref:Uncharacterized protein n=1 Tax=Leclercia adecarboxylata TaxID=83655 RepID=A0A4U9I2S5_9ENTR|nr:Uncharacterised protein [Leclercia adecarboxylata]